MNKIMNAGSEIGGSRLEVEVLATRSSHRFRFLLGSNELPSELNGEMLRRMRNSNMLFMHNSTSRIESYFYDGRRGRVMFDLILSTDEVELLAQARQNLDRRLKKIALTRTAEISGMLGRLAERFEVEFAPLERGSSSELPMSVLLKDKSVSAPLSDWGSGTQNRTHIIMALLQAFKMRNQEKPTERTTPIVLIEEPECFLHPSAQAEFGRVLRDLSEELGIQVIATTHSPYLLNSKSTDANILMNRKNVRGSPRESVVVDTKSDRWTEPFAIHLGVTSESLAPFHEILSSDVKKILFVEGDTDRRYFEHCKKAGRSDCRLDADIVVKEYGGKDALKNNIMLRFIWEHFKSAYFTFDLDAEGEVTRHLIGIGLKSGENFSAVGINKPGLRCIEGLMPDEMRASVYASNPDIVAGSGSAIAADRNSAKNRLKSLLLKEFEARAEIVPGAGFSELGRLIRRINQALK